MLVNQQVEVNITGQQLVDEIRKRLDVKGYKLVEGEVFYYERVSWDDYDYVSQQKPPTFIKPRLEALNALILELNLSRNTYLEPREIT